MSAEAKEAAAAVLHAPFDNVVWNSLWARTRIDFPSLRQGGYYVHLSRSDYDTYQQHLLSTQLRDVLEITQPMIRIEIEQLLWGAGSTATNRA